MTRTSLILPNTLHQRLLLMADYEGKTLSDLVREILDKVLQAREQARLSRMYQILKEVKGICKEPITDASTTIDETLYGEHGAWRGETE